MFFSGNGGDAGRINFRARHINGEVRLSVCRGSGAVAALNGRAGPGKLAGTFGNKDLKKSRFSATHVKDLRIFFTHVVLDKAEWLISKLHKT